MASDTTVQFNLTQGEVMDLVYSLLESSDRCKGDSESEAYYEALADKLEGLLNSLKVLPAEQRVARLVMAL